MSSAARHIVRAILPGARRWLDIMLPPTMLGAGETAAAEAWQPDEPNTYCRRCGSTASFAAMTLEGCPGCRGRRVPWHGVWRLGAYREPLSQWIVQLKFQRQWDWAAYLGRRLAAATPGAPGVPATPGVERADFGELSRAAVVPVPLHWLRRISRGYDQAHLMAAAFAKAKRLPLAPVLRRRRATAPQSHLHSHAARMANTRAAFTIAPVDLRGWTIWLIDDVTTTGATARRCAHLLRRAGAERIHLAVIAVADPKQPDAPSGSINDQAPMTKESPTAQ